MTDSTNSEAQENNRGGTRQGAGRPRQHPDLLKEPFSCGLPRYIIEFLRNHDTSQPVLIENALLAEHPELRETLADIYNEKYA